MREQTGAGWEKQPYSLKVTFVDCWQLKFESQEREAEDEPECSQFPGWLTPDEMIVVLDQINLRTNGNCVNVEEAKANLAEIRTTGILSSDTLRYGVNAAQRAQGRVFCIS